MLDHVSSFKGEAKKVRKSVENELYLMALNGSGFDVYVNLMNLRQWRIFVIFLKNGAGFISLKIIIAYVDENKEFVKLFILNVGEFISTVFEKNSP